MNSHAPSGLYGSDATTSPFTMPYSDLIKRVGAVPPGNGATAEDTVSQQLSTLLTSIRRHLHANPEVGFQEYQTSAFIREMLEMHGLVVHGPIAGTGLFTDIEGSAPGPGVGYRADIDALPIQDEKNVPYASRNPGVAHLCGHDAHTAVAIGTALLLHDRRDDFQGRVRVFFQPNEEGMPSGAPRMIDAGVLDGLEAVYAMHVDPTLEAGRFGLITGAITAACDQFQLVVRGASTGHSARPHQYSDTVWIANQIMTSLYEVLGRRTDARNPSVLTICRVHGGEAFNVIPASVEIGGTLRTTHPEERASIKEYIRDTAERIATWHGASAEVNIVSGSPALINDRRLVDHVERLIQSAHGREAVYWVPAPSMGSEDFAHYTQRVPGALIRLGIASSAETSHSLHNGHFDLDEQVLAPAARLAADVLIAHLNDQPLQNSPYH